MTQQQPPKIVFPCRYSIRVIGQESQVFRERVIEIVRRHAPGLDDTQVTIKPSKKGNFVRVYLVIEATGEQQLRDIHESLKQYSAVKMVI